MLKSIQGTLTTTTFPAAAALQPVSINGAKNITFAAGVEIPDLHATR